MPIYVTDARPFGELLDIRELVQPRTFMIQQLLRSIKSTGDRAIEEAWGASVCQIRYPPQQPVDWHRVQAYRQKSSGLFGLPTSAPVFDIETTEVLESPQEVLVLGMADCDGQSILACSVLRNFLRPEEVFVTLGSWNGFGHAWVTLMRDHPMVLETTKQHEACKLAFAGLVEGIEYVPMFRFNDVYAQDLSSLAEGNGEIRYLPLEKVGLHVQHMEKLDCLCGHSFL